MRPTLKSAVLRWYKCRVRGWHIYRFYRKNKDGFVELKCYRCAKVRVTNQRRKVRHLEMGTPV